MKIYEKPTLELVLFAVFDVLCDQSDGQEVED